MPLNIIFEEKAGLSCHSCFAKIIRMKKSEEQQSAVMKKNRTKSSKRLLVGKKPRTLRLLFSKSQTINQEMAS
jgi:hypothetical protein